MVFMFVLTVVLELPFSHQVFVKAKVNGYNFQPSQSGITLGSIEKTKEK
jgi:hypothetical protein